MPEFNAEDFIADLSARELSELRALLNDEEYSRIIEDWEEQIPQEED